MTFAIITPALITGAFADRMKFSAMMWFMGLWSLLVYSPIAHMMWEPAGKFAAMGILDFAGGTVVHINAAIAGLIGAYLLGKRVGYGKDSMAPHSLTMTMIGASLLWFGWFGFNAGSALEANGTAALAFVNTWLATATAATSWMFAEWLIKGKPSMLGAASGAVAGLVAITPAAGFVGVVGALVIGLAAGVICLWGVNGLKKLLGADDSLDVFGVHGVGGTLGSILTGVFAAPSLGGTGVYDYVANKVAENYSIMDQVVIQATGVGVTLVWSGVVAFICYKIVDMVIGLRVPEDEEREGLDITSHGESAYHTS
jgi:Amt family ammonium transporter